MKKRKGKRRLTKRSGSDKKLNLFRHSWEYLKKSQRYIYLAVALFFVSVFVAFAFPENFVFFDKLLADLVLQIEGLGLFGLIWFILKNNVSTAFFAMIAGVVFGIFPVINAITNGAISGYVIAKASAVGGPSVILLLIPHGIFELPAIFISLGLGIRLGMFVFAPKGKKINEFRIRFWSSLGVFLTIVLPLLIIGAIIEGYLIFYG